MRKRRYGFFKIATKSQNGAYAQTDLLARGLGRTPKHRLAGQFPRSPTQLYSTNLFRSLRSMTTLRAGEGGAGLLPFQSIHCFAHTRAAHLRPLPGSADKCEMCKPGKPRCANARACDD